MLYTFTVTDRVLARIEDYLNSHYQDRPSQYILSAQSSIFGDYYFIIVDCDDTTATYISLLC